MSSFNLFGKKIRNRQEDGNSSNDIKTVPKPPKTPNDSLNSPENYCPFDNLDDCPYWSEDDCKNKKKDCYHHSIEKMKCGWEPEKCKAVILVLVAIIGIFCSDKWVSETHPTFHLMITGISMSLIAGVIISFIVDLPKSLRKNEESILNALASDSYIKKLNNERLRDMRGRITDLLYKKDAPRLPKGLIMLDQKICELLMEPYYDRYNRRDIYRMIEYEGKPYVEKTICISWQLINPRTEAQSEAITQDIELPVADKSQIAKLVQIRKAEILIDGKHTHNIEKEIKLFNDLNAEMNNYNCRVRWSKSENKFEPHNFSYRHRIAAEICYVLILPATDVWHGTKLRHAATSFHFNCSHNNPNIQIYGQVLGSLVENNDFAINNVTPNEIIIDVNTWLLPKNGIIIVFGPLAN